MQTKEAVTVAPSSRPYRISRGPADAKAADAQLEAYKKKMQGELKGGKNVKLLEMKPAGPLATVSVISLVANGSTTVSPGCEVELTATTPHNGDFYDWVLMNGSQHVSLGQTDGNTTSISVVVTAASLGSGNYTVQTTSWVYDYWKQQWISFGPFPSNPVTVQFSGPSGGQLYSMSLDTSSVKGGNNGHDPTLTIYLDGPAPSCGQKVYLSTSDPYLAWIFGTQEFTIPGGQNHDSITWFVGTRKVFITKKVNIIASVNGQLGYAQLEVRK
jgi:hypothetical protein